MGFSPAQARTALAKTESGVDVQAALESLLNGDASSPSPRPQSSSTATSQPPRGSSQSQRSSRRTRPEPPERANSNSGQNAQALQDQADKLLAQASEIGLSMFNKANAFWASGKERVQKAYEERAAAAAASSSKGNKDGRPRWMQDAAEGGGFRDDDDDDDKEAGMSTQQARKPKQARPSKTGDERTAPDASSSSFPAAPAPEGDLFGGFSTPSNNNNNNNSENRGVYKSPFRHAGGAGRSRNAVSQAQTASAPPPVQPKSKPKPQPQPQPQRAPSPITRKTVSASPSAISTAAQHRTHGTELYKLGQYADAASSYTLALDALPDGHLLRVPLLTNRAAARLKTGEYAAAVEDCQATIEIVGAGYHPARERRVERAEDGAGVDLGAGWVKAWRRRAEAWEGREKWVEAGKSWETLAGAEWAPAAEKAEAVRGAGRCRRMLTAAAAAQASGGGDENLTGVTAVKPKPKPRPAAAPPARPAVVSQVPSEALDKLRAANSAAEAEDTERFNLKDNVEARLNAWKGGKETNIRALIQSLDTVLWPELGWSKVNMSELISPAQVKVRYMKAIARVHPDKVSSLTALVEKIFFLNLLCFAVER
jgi:tetratricopeptide (TPR) repeat protein